MADVVPSSVYLSSKAGLLIHLKKKTHLKTRKKGNFGGSEVSPEGATVQTYFSSSLPPLAKRESGVPLDTHPAQFDVEVLHDVVLRLRRKTFEGVEGPVVIAAFDLDHTLISTKTGYIFPINGNDWKILPGISDQLALNFDRIEKENKTLVPVIFTNQGGVVPNKTAKSFNNLVTKLEGAGSALGRFPLIYASMKAADEEKKAVFRKPGAGMFELLKQDLPNAEIDMEQSFYVGDAAGRPDDHSRADIDFAKNANLTFYTPEEFFGIEIVL